MVHLFSVRIFNCWFIIGNEPMLYKLDNNYGKQGNK